MLQPQITNSSPGLNDFRCQLLLAAFYLILVCAWSIGIAFNGAPDESTHFFLLEFLNKFHTLPSAVEPREPLLGLISGRTWQPGEFWYHGLPFPHVLGAWITTKISAWFLPADVLYIGARSFNWILGGIFISSLFRAARSLGSPLLISALIAACISLIPQVTFVFSYFNSDGYGLTSIALLLSTSISFINSPTRKRALYLGLAIGMMLMAKLYFLPALVFVVVNLLTNRAFKNKRLFVHLPTSIIAASVVAAPMLLLVYSSYGEISGVSGQIDFVNMHKTNPAAGFGTCYIFCGGQTLNYSNLLSWLGLTLRSYFSVTGWMNIFIPSIYYPVAASIFLLAVLASLYQARRMGKSESSKDMVVNFVLPVVMILGLYPAMILLSLIASQNSLPQPQGRYLFVTIPFLAFLLSITTQRILERTNHEHA
ncbi:DUF2142 domain-containing protein [Pseudomonas sp. LP_7_YM]|uniref:DUF2142 domain-containing protein n=1 Tax=Pseudomonas sp. LP_7_YM TaxID=2485137 RepID=UPI0010E15C90|nr:DUF2142 domain-containing protein [Pseudomonas sp. LP_7_YM]TDV61899.1 putative membrane protein DUF2142 [Pseudomonas sp. LP_7_YM]